MDKFIEAIGTIRITNGLVSIQTLRQSQNLDGTSHAQERGDLILSLASFLKLHSGLNAAVEQMVNQGLLTRKNDTTDNVDTVEAVADPEGVSDVVEVSGKSLKRKKH